MEFTLTSGSLEVNQNMDGWVITSNHATIDGAEDVPLKRGDKINIDGDVYRNNEHIANIA